MNEKSLAHDAASRLPTNRFNSGDWTDADLASAGFGSIGQSVRIAQSCTIVGTQNIHIDDNVRIDGPTVLSAGSGHIRIGSYIRIGDTCFLAGAGGIDLEDFSGLSQGARIDSACDDYSSHALTNPAVPREVLNVEIAPVRLRPDADSNYELAISSRPNDVQATQNNYATKGTFNTATSEAENNMLSKTKNMIRVSADV
ncbi:hypothetical protein [Paraburkholderia unamae]|uniref:Acyltransferase n=1 Tax=Paraburkholderia unamae TaxID=219649 RepID=A0ABX5KYB5_9BURK|nr:hypothetical protein [Paraburkholderia unamae]PVX85802.1 hypothetical protein C7402_103380 [Paraburkholderia unamae]